MRVSGDLTGCRDRLGEDDSRATERRSRRRRRRCGRRWDERCRSRCALRRRNMARTSESRVLVVERLDEVEARIARARPCPIHIVPILPHCRTCRTAGRWAMGDGRWAASPTPIDITASWRSSRARRLVGRLHAAIGVFAVRRRARRGRSAGRFVDVVEQALILRDRSRAAVRFRRVRDARGHAGGPRAFFTREPAVTHPRAEIDDRPVHVGGDRNRSGVRRARWPRRRRRRARAPRRRRISPRSRVWIVGFLQNSATAGDHERSNDQRDEKAGEEDSHARRRATRMPLLARSRAR